MSYSHAKVDLSLIPDDSPEKNTFILFAEKHNAVVDISGEMKQDLDQISGATPEEKEGLYKTLALVRKLTHYIHGKRFNLTLLMVQGYVGLGILKQVGLTPEQGHRLFEFLIHFLEKLS